MSTFQRLDWVNSRISSLKPYERHLSALGMLGGFTFDNYAFGRVDHPATQIVLAAYVVIAGASIAALHAYESAGERPGTKPWRTFLSTATQFALGGLWSAFVVFYSRSAVVSASWPFLLLLGGLLIGNEAFRAYHTRLVFTAILFFFALFSYTIFAVPVFVGTIGTDTFLLSGATAVLAYFLFLIVLDGLGAPRFRPVRRQIVLGAAAIFATLNLFYFTSLLPPLPIALANAGVYHSVKRVGMDYVAEDEAQPWYVALGAPAEMHIRPNDRLYVYSAVFAPIALKTRIAHHWQHYDVPNNRWTDEATVSYPIIGGRNDGYRAYSIKSNLRAGNWRVDIDTVDGRLIGRVQFLVVVGPAARPTETRMLR